MSLRRQPPVQAKEEEDDRNRLVSLSQVIQIGVVQTKTPPQVAPSRVIELKEETIVKVLRNFRSHLQPGDNLVTILYAGKSGSYILDGDSIRLTTGNAFTFPISYRGGNFKGVEIGFYGLSTFNALTKNDVSQMSSLLPDLWSMIQPNYTETEIEVINPPFEGDFQSTCQLEFTNDTSRAQTQLETYTRVGENAICVEVFKLSEFRGGYYGTGTEWVRDGSVTDYYTLKTKLHSMRLHTCRLILDRTF